MLSKIKQNKIAFLFGFLGSSLLIFQFLLRSGLWVDEFNVVESLINRDFLGLLKPLERFQVAPIFFIIIEKVLFNISKFFTIDVEYFLRLYPLFCGLGIVFLYYPTILKLTNSKFISLLSYGLLIFNPSFIYYTSEVKPYICELFYFLLLINLYLNLSDKYSFKKQLLFVLISFVGILNSFSICTAFLVFGLYDGWKIINKKKKFTNITLKRNIEVYIFTYLSIFLFLLIYFFTFFYHHEHIEFMNNYWQHLFFLFKNLSYINKKEFWNFFYRSYNFYVLFITLFLLLFLKNKFVFMLAFCPIAFHIILSYFHYYPFCLRLCLYWFIFIPIMISNVVYQIVKHLKIKTKNYSILSLLLIILVIISEINYTPFPVYIYNDLYTKKPLEYINKSYKKDDILVFKGLWLPLTFFNPYLRNIPPERTYKYLDYLLEHDDRYLPFIESQNLSKDELNYLLSDKDDKTNLYSYCVIYHPDLIKEKRIWFIAYADTKDALKKTLEHVIALKNSKRKVVFCDIKAETSFCLIE